MLESRAQGGCDLIGAQASAYVLGLPSAYAIGACQWIWQSGARPRSSVFLAIVGGLGASLGADGRCVTQSKRNFDGRAKRQGLAICRARGRHRRRREAPDDQEVHVRSLPALAVSRVQ